MNGLKKDTWVKMWKPEMETEAAMIYDALNDIHSVAKKKYLTKTQAIIFVLAALAFNNVGWPLIAKIFM